MLHDLFMVSEFFEPPYNAAREEEVLKAYGETALKTALSLGLLERRTTPCTMGDGFAFYVLSDTGHQLVLNEREQ